MNNEKLSTIDFKALETIIGEKTGYHVALTPEYKDDSVYVKSQELSTLAGIMSCLYKTLIIGNFNGGVTKDEKHYWMPIHFKFEYVKGGSNGAELFTAWWSFEDKKWTVE